MIESKEDDPLATGRALFYTWGNREHDREHFRSHVSDRISVWLLRGPEDTGQGWLTEERDVAADYRRAFGEEPPALRVVGFLSDTDQTGATVVAGLRGLCLSGAE